MILPQPRNLDARLTCKAQGKRGFEGALEFCTCCVWRVPQSSFIASIPPGVDSPNRMMQLNGRCGPGSQESRGDQACKAPQQQLCHNDHTQVGSRSKILHLLGLLTEEVPTKEKLLLTCLHRISCAGAKIHTTRSP
jgi:hypothetical protein